MQYEIISKQNSVSMGMYEGERPIDALAAHIRDAGYNVTYVDDRTLRASDPVPKGRYEVQGESVARITVV